MLQAYLSCLMLCAVNIQKVSVPNYSVKISSWKVEEREEEDPRAESSKEVVDHILKTTAVVGMIMTSKEDNTLEMQ